MLNPLSVWTSFRRPLFWCLFCWPVWWGMICPFSVKRQSHRWIHCLRRWWSQPSLSELRSPPWVWSWQWRSFTTMGLWTGKKCCPWRTLCNKHTEGKDCLWHKSHYFWYLHLSCLQRWSLSSTSVSSIIAPCSFNP